MLAYLEALCSALKIRDARVIAELLRHPLATALPTLVKEEAERIAAQGVGGFLAPVHALHLYHQTAHLLGACADPATRRRLIVPVRVVNERPRQMELELPYQAAVA